MSESTFASHDPHKSGNPYPWLLEATGGVYKIHGRARLPEHAKPPSQFIGGRLTWEPLAADLWRFTGEAGGNTPGGSTVLARNALGDIGEAEIALINRGIMDALWAAGCRAARIDSYVWEADPDGAYTLTGDLVACGVDEATEEETDTPERVIVRGDLADAVACLSAVFGRALEVGAWVRNQGGLLMAPVVRWAPEVAR